MTGIELRHGRDDDQLGAYVGVRGAVWPDLQATVDEEREQQLLDPAGCIVIALQHQRPVGAACVARYFILPVDYPALWASIDVVAAARGQGVGTMLYHAISDAARRRGKLSLGIRAGQEHPQGIAWALRRGFRETDREQVVELRLAGVEPASVRPPSGIRLVAIAQRPDLVPDVWRLAVEAFAEVPGEDRMHAGDYDYWRAHFFDRSTVRTDGYVVALAGEAVVGYGAVHASRAQPGVAWHDMTAVTRSWRGRGVAAAIKRWQIAWAKAAGFESLCTENDITNAPMRAINASLGYRPKPEVVHLLGPLASAKPDSI